MKSGKTVYLAARYGRREEMRSYIPELNSLGYGVPCTWVTTDRDHPGDDPEALAVAQKDAEELLAANLVIAFMDEQEVPGSARGGRHVEFGIAMANSMMTIVIGPPESIFHQLAAFRFDTWEEALVMLKAYNR